MPLWVDVRRLRDFLGCSHSQSPPRKRAAEQVGLLRRLRKTSSTKCPEGCDENGPAAMRCMRSVLALLLPESAKRGRFAYALAGGPF